ncbi:vWA domain-containing protein [Roseibium sediminis]|uniref:vWA domain-containing protein n=1 Tax=Roseibium sediminis TaxID=1775174 RepID=UPI00123E0BDB|nr:VWA domain-containing protein [Roseibium sediminis]
MLHVFRLLVACWNKTIRRDRTWALLFALLIAQAVPVSSPSIAVAAEADKATVLILDASGSMWGRLKDGQTKIEVARDVLGGFLLSRDASVPLGAVAYGHNRKGDCSDIEVISPVSGQGAVVLAQRLDRISPKGKTPLGQSLLLAAREVPRTAEEADIVLVTDGLETCGVDPCEVAKSLANEGIKLRAHVVGFGLTVAEANTLACVPEATGGLLMRPQSGAELAEALARVSAEIPAAAPVGTRLFFSYPGSMPDSYQWTLRDEQTGLEKVLATVSGDARYQAFPIEVAAGAYTAIVTAKAGRGETSFVVGSEPQDIYVVMKGQLPVIALRDRGPYAARGESVVIDLRFLQAGQEEGGAAFALRLYSAGGESITYSTVDGKEGSKSASINLPAEPGRYILKLETWGEEVLEELEIVAETDPEVSLMAPVSVEPGAEIQIQSTGSQMRSDHIEIWQGDTQIGWAVTLASLSEGNKLTAPEEPGTYDIVYVSTNTAWDRVEKARVQIEVGTVQDDATGAGALRKKVEAGTEQRGGTEQGAVGTYQHEVGEDSVYACAGPAPCQITDAATGLSFLLPAGWWTDQPSQEAYTAGQQEAGVRVPPHVNVFRTGSNDAFVLGPHQWSSFNGPCEDVGDLGQFCMFSSSDVEVLSAFQLIKATLIWQPVSVPIVSAPPAPVSAPDFAGEVMKQMAGEDPQTKAMLNALLGAAQNAGPNGEIDQGAVLNALLGAMQAGEMEGQACADALGHGPDRCENGKEAGGKAWSDYPHRCLPGDKTTPSCDIRDQESGLAFYLPENWVADVQAASPHPRAEFVQKTGSAHSIWLNPENWPLGDRGCYLTRAGSLCADPDQSDDDLVRALQTLQFTLTTGEVIRRCADEACEFKYPNPPVISGRMPALWSVEAARQREDGRYSTWFFDRDRGGNFKLIGLNQDEGENCREAAANQLLCEFTPYISEAEFGLIRSNLVVGGASGQPAALNGQQLLDLLAPSRKAAQ